MIADRIGPCDSTGESAKLAIQEAASLADRFMADDMERQAESRKILDRVAREAGSDGATFLSGTARRAGEHVAARDADQDDRIELWGTRIGRALGLVITIALFVWLILYLLRG